MNNSKPTQPNWPAKVPGQKSGGNRDNNSPKVPVTPKPQPPVKKGK